jgi:hypothetical protein
VFLAGLEGVIPTLERSYFQPVDVWIGRVAEFLNSVLTFGKDKPSTISRYLAEACTQAGVSAIAFNQGGWYFGGQVAGTADRLIRLLEELGSRPPSSATAGTPPGTAYHGRVWQAEGLARGPGPWTMPSQTMRTSVHSSRRTAATPHSEVRLRRADSGSRQGSCNHTQERPLFSSV